MAFDEALADRVRALLAEHGPLREQRMFGGLAFLERGVMIVAVAGDGLLIRADPTRHQELLGEPGAAPMRMGERTMRGWLRVGSDALATDGQLRAWLDRSLAYAGTLPPKG